MEQSFWTQESFIWGGILILGFPLLTLLLGEIIYRAQSTGKHKFLVATLMVVRNLVFPSLALFILLSKIIGLSENTTPMRIVQTGLLIFTIHASLIMLNGMLFGAAKTGTWQANVPKLFRDLTRFFLILMGVAFVLSVVWGADLGGLIAALGVGSIVLGLALQDTLGNLFSGIALLFERPFSEGDWLEVGDINGKVIEINWRSVHLLTRELEMLIIPNAVLAKEILRNFRRPQRLHVEPVDVGFSYNDPPNKVKRVMKETALATRGVLDRPEPVIQTISYDDSSIGYRVRLYLADYDKVPQIRDEFVTRIWYAAERNGLNIPFPIRTVYHNPPVKSKPDEVLEQFVNYIRTFPSFININIDTLEELAKEATLKHFGAGERAVQQGASVEGLYLIIAGKAEITVQQNVAADSREYEIASLGRGEFFGEMAWIEGKVSPVSVTAVDDLEVLIIKEEIIQTLLDRIPRLRQEIGALIETRRKEIDFILKSHPQSENSNGSKYRSR